MESFRLRQQLQRDLKGDAKQPFVSSEQAAPIGAHAFATGVSPLHHFACGQDGFYAKNMIGRHPVLQAVCAARVEGHIASDGANRLAGRVGRIMKSMRSSGLRNLRVNHTGFDYSQALFRIDAQYPVEAIQSNDHAPCYRQRTP